MNPRIAGPVRIARDLLRSPAAALLLVPFLMAAGPMEMKRVPKGQLPRYVDPSDTLHPHVMYVDSTVSLNDRCAVRQTRLSPMRRPVYVNRHPVGFC